MTTNTTEKDFLTIKQLAKDPSCPLSEAALRFHIWRAGVNGLAPAIFRIGRRILIRRSAWVLWLEQHCQKGGK